jgi:30S ribosome assembly GTPase
MIKMSNKQCLGCGAILQNKALGLGYVKDLNQDYCQSCFRLRHYRDFKHVRADVDESATLDFIENFDGHIVWVVDIMRLSQSLHDGMIRSFKGKSVVMVVNKRDLLPKSVSNTKLRHAIMRMLREYNVTLSEVIFLSALKRQSLEPLIPYLEDAPCAFVGNINAGKSSLLNTLLDTKQLAVSPVSSTTANIIFIDGEYEVYDTPGFVKESKLVSKYSDENLVQLSPQKVIKPLVYQIYEKQAILIGNVGAIIVDPIDTAKIISYLPIKVKRIKPDRVAANLALDHEFMIQDPKYRKRNWPTREEKIDLEIFDLGFITVSGTLKTLETVMDETAEVVLRKAII